MASFGYYSNREPHKLIQLLHNRKLTILLAAVSVVTALILFSNRGVIQRIKLGQEKSELIARIAELEKENARLRREEQNLIHDPSTIEHVARERHGMIRPGEIVYRIREVR